MFDPISEHLHRCNCLQSVMRCVPDAHRWCMVYVGWAIKRVQFVIRVFTKPASERSPIIVFGWMVTITSIQLTPIFGLLCLDCFVSSCQSFPFFVWFFSIGFGLAAQFLCSIYSFFQICEHSSILMVVKAYRPQLRSPIHFQYIQLCCAHRCHSRPHTAAHCASILLALQDSNGIDRSAQQQDRDQTPIALFESMYKEILIWFLLLGCVLASQ